MKVGIKWGSALVSVGAIAGLTTGVLVLLGSESRLIYSMARDGLIPAGFSKVGENGVPKKAVMCGWARRNTACGVRADRQYSGTVQHRNALGIFYDISHCDSFA